MANILGTSVNDTLSGGGPADTVRGYDGNDSLSGGGGNDTIFGNTGADTIDGGAADDTIDGGSGNDSLLGGIGNDTISGGTAGVVGAAQTGAGTTANPYVLAAFRNTGLSYATTTGSTFNFSTSGNIFSVSATDNDAILNDWTAGNYYGTTTPAQNDGDPTSVVSASNIPGLAVGELLTSGRWFTLTYTDPTSGQQETVEVFLLWDDTNNTSTPSGGTSTYVFATKPLVNGVTYSVTTISENAGVPWSALTPSATGVSQGGGADTLDGGDGDDRLLGGDGNDSILGGQGVDNIDGGADDDFIDGGTEADSIDGGTGNDSILGGTGTFNDTLIGNDGNDTIRGDAGADSITGGQGVDSLDGGADNDFIDGGTEADSIDGGTGNDLILGGTGTFNDTLIGNDGNDTIRGDAGADSITGGQGVDSLDGGADNDFIDGGTEADSIDGGTGNDSILGGTGTFNDTLIGGDGDDTISGDAGNDSILGGLGADSILGGLGDDTILFGAGDDTVLGGDGNDVIDDVNGSNLVGANLIDGEGGADTIWGGAGNDTLIGGTGNDSLLGEDDNDRLQGDAGNDTLIGGAGNDSLTGGADDDSLAGDAGNDTLSGDAGNDTLTGGVGDDRFVWDAASNNDVITDFNTGNTGSTTDGNQANNDFVDLSGIFNPATLAAYNAANGTNFPQAILALNHDLADGVINFNGTNMTGPTLTLTGITGGLTFDQTNVTCFTAGTLIETATGPRAVESLMPGDLVMTRDHGLQELRWIGRRRISLAEQIVNPALRPVRIGAGALGADLPRTDLMVSPQHRVLITGAGAEMLFGEAEVLVVARHLVDDVAVTQAYLPEVTYVHILFDRHEIVQTAGLWSESFQPAERTLGAMDAAQRAEIAALFPGVSGQAFDAARPTLKAHETRVLMAG